MDSNTSLAVGGRAVMRVGRNLVEVRIVEKIEGGWNVISRTGKTVAARELTPEERETSPGAHLAVMSFSQRTRPQAAEATTSEPPTATETPAAETAEAEATSATEAAATPVAPTAVETAEEPTAPAIVPSERAVPRKGLSLLSAAAAVLEAFSEPLAVKAIIEKAKEANLWSPTNGKTPEQTLYSAIIREIKGKGDRARFRKEGHGLFTFAR